MQKTAILFTKVEKFLPIRTAHIVNLCFSVLLTMSNMKLLMVTNTISRLTLKTELINWGKTDSKSFPYDCMEIFTKDLQEKYCSFLLLLSSFPHPLHFSITLLVTTLSRLLPAEN